MDKRICPNCGESCEKEYETIVVQGAEFCVCCNYELESYFTDQTLIMNSKEETGDINNAFIDFFNESGLLKSQNLWYLDYP